MTHITNLPVLHDLKFIIPHKISGERIRVRDETENDDQNDMPATERRRPGSLIFRFFLHNFHLSLHGMIFLLLVLTLLLAQITNYNPFGVCAFESGSQYELVLNGTYLHVTLVTG